MHKTYLIGTADVKNVLYAMDDNDDVMEDDHVNAVYVMDVIMDDLDLDLEVVDVDVYCSYLLCRYIVQKEAMVQVVFVN